MYTGDNDGNLANYPKDKGHTPTKYTWVKNAIFSNLSDLFLTMTQSCVAQNEIKKYSNSKIFPLVCFSVLVTTLFISFYLVLSLTKGGYLNKNTTAYFKTMTTYTHTFVLSLLTLKDQLSSFSTVRPAWDHMCKTAFSVPFKFLFKILLRIDAHITTDLSLSNICAPVFTSTTFRSCQLFFSVFWLHQLKNDWCPLLGLL